MVDIVACEHVPVPGAEVRAWCGRAGELVDVLSSTDRAVLVACPEGPTLPAVQRLAARAGLRPHNLDYLRIDPHSGPAEAAALVSAAAARLAVDAPDSPAAEERPATLSRRALLRIEAPLRFPVPATTAPCPARCSVCAGACPTGALTLEGGIPAIDPDRCSGCGLCVSTCPTGALVDPVATPDRVDTHVGSLLSGNIPAIAYACRHRLSASLPAGWASVAVTGLGSVRVAWILSPLLRGAAAVTVLACEDCPPVDARIGLARILLSAAGADPERVLAEPGAVLPPVSLPAWPLGDPFGPLGDPFGPLGAAAVVAALGGVGDIVDPASPLGRVTIGDRCTASFMCVSACPTGALRLRQEGAERIVELDPEGCVACGACLTACPEGGKGALDVAAGLALPFDPTVRELRRHRGRPCPRCGTLTYDGPMRARVAELLAVDDDGLDCDRCRTGPVDAFARALGMTIP